MKTGQGKQGLGPNSKIFERGIISGLDGRSREGRFARKLETELLAQLGSEPTTAERLLVQRAVRAQLQLALFDEQLDEGKELSPHSSARYGALGNQLRLALVALGLKPRVPKSRTPSLSEIASRYAQA